MECPQPNDCRMSVDTSEDSQPLSTSTDPSGPLSGSVSRVPCENYARVSRVPLPLKYLVRAPRPYDRISERDQLPAQSEIPIFEDGTTYEHPKHPDSTLPHPSQYKSMQFAEDALHYDSASGAHHANSDSLTYIAHPSRKRALLVRGVLITVD